MVVAVKDDMNRVPNGDPCMLVSEHVCTFFQWCVDRHIENSYYLSLSLSLSLQVLGSLDATADSSSSRQYLINVTLHSGHNLAIRDRTGWLLKQQFIYLVHVGRL
jgi:hypothetical protein